MFGKRKKSRGFLSIFFVHYYTYLLLVNELYYCKYVKINIFKKENQIGYSARNAIEIIIYSV